MTFVDMERQQRWGNRSFVGVGPAAEVLIQPGEGELWVLTSVFVVFQGGGSGGWVQLLITEASASIQLWESVPASSSTQKETWVGWLPITYGQGLEVNLINGGWHVTIGGYLKPQAPA
jgi:hypothetical protein